MEDSQTVNHVGGILREGGDLVVFFHLCSKSATYLIKNERQANIVMYVTIPNHLHLFASKSHN